MPSADQVPINSPHSIMLGENWVVLIAGSTGSALRAVCPPNLHIAPVVQREERKSIASAASLRRTEARDLSGSGTIGLAPVPSEIKDVGRTSQRLAYRPKTTPA